MAVTAYVVDDLAGMRYLVCLALEECGCQVVGASAHEDALSAIGLADPQVIVVDVGRPVEPALDFLTELRGLMPRTPILSLVTAEEFRGLALAAGSTAVLNKLQQWDDLQGAIRDIGVQAE